MPPSKKPPSKVYPAKPQDMPGTSFQLVTQESMRAKFTPRVIAAIDGHQKSGKTHLALAGMPRAGLPGVREGLFYFRADRSLEGVAEKVLDPAKDRGPFYQADYLLDVRDLEDASEDEIKKAAKPIAKQFWADIYATIKKNARSLVVDSASELYEIDRLAEWGRAAMKPHHYTPINARWRNLFRALAMSKCNAIFLHRLTELYVDDKPTGTFRRQGFTKTGFEVQLNATVWREPGKPGLEAFHLTVDDNGYDPDLNGMDMSGDEFDLRTLLGRIFPQLDEDYWQ